MQDIIQQAREAKQASYALATMNRAKKDRILCAMADALELHAESILKRNEEDVRAAIEGGIRQSMVDRLSLNPSRISAMADGLRMVADLDDPTSHTIAMWETKDNLRIGKRRVPLGVVGIIYEARPNVTADAIGICIKSGNACILRGGSEAIRTNLETVRVMKGAAQAAGLPKGAIQLVEDTSREVATEMMHLNGLVDVLIPRGGAGLIQSVVKNATVPVIQTGVGNCHIYVDRSAKQDMALDILINAKCSRPSVCNAAESLLIDREIAVEFLPKAVRALEEKQVEIRGCEACRQICPGIQAATEEDFDTEYNDLILSVKIVEDIEAAIKHINAHGTGHSEAIITQSYEHAERFLAAVDAAAVYVNASTRFTDGGEFGFGAEIGISTQKLHARGPMGLEEMTSYKYVVYGNGQIR